MKKVPKHTPELCEKTDDPMYAHGAELEKIFKSVAIYIGCLGLFILLMKCYFN